MLQRWFIRRYTDLLEMLDWCHKVIIGVYTYLNTAGISLKQVNVIKHDFTVQFSGPGRVIVRLCLCVSGY